MRKLLAMVVLAGVPACSAAPSAQAVETYVGHVRAGRLKQAFAMTTADRQKELGVDGWKSAMNTAVLGDAQSVSVSGLRTLSPGGTCVYTQLDLVGRPDKGPYGHYIFYLQQEAGAYRVQDVLTYDRIDGEGLVKTGHFDESREPFACSSKRP